MTELVLALGSEMLFLSEAAASRKAAVERLKAQLANKAAAEQFKVFIAAQGGLAEVVDNPGLLPKSRIVTPVASARSGFVQGIDAFEAGMAAKILGAGRQTKAFIN